MTLAILLALTAGAQGAGAAVGAGGHARAPAHALRPLGMPVSVTVEASPVGAPVPQDFLGLSYENYSLPQIASYASHGNLATFLRSLGAGVLRFGGITADENVAWHDAFAPAPGWASAVLEGGSLYELGSLAAASDWHVLLTLGLGHYEPQAAAREATVAKAALGEWLEAIELGNEPNSLGQHGLRPLPWTAVQYDEQISAYRSAIAAGAPGIPLAGPDISGAGAIDSWALPEVIAQRPAMLTGHHYPLGCAEQPPPSIEKLLGPKVRRKEEASIQHYLTLAQSAEIPFRMDETNSVSCGGVAGISNTFASALWAAGYLARAMNMGVSGVNMHGSLSNCGGYSPLCAPTAQALAAGQLRAQPEWYALLLVKQLVGDRPLRTVLGAAASANVSASSFLAPDGALEVLFVDDEPPGSRRAAVTLHAGSGYADGSMLSLTGPSPSALSGVRLGGRSVGLDGVWSPPSRLPTARNRGGLIELTLAPSSAILLTVARRAQ